MPCPHAETANSTVGNVFMDTIQAYAANHPTIPAEGNHEVCTRNCLRSPPCRPSAVQAQGACDTRFFTHATSPAKQHLIQYVFMQSCETCPAVPVVPYSAGNFSEYTARMWSVASVGAGLVSGSGTPRYYSFDQGLAHFLVFSAEAYTYKSGKEFLANQLSFMTADLQKVDRQKTPWVVGLVHKCFWMEAEAYAAFNPVLMSGGVDLILCGHVHYYNRLYPYDLSTGKLDKASVSKDGSTYTNPKYPVNIVTGAPGNREDTGAYKPGDPSYTGTSDYGYGFLSFPDANHATWTFKAIKAVPEGSSNYTDTLTIVKSKST